MKFGRKDKDDGRLWVTSETVVIEVTVDHALQAPCLAHLAVKEIPKCQRCINDERERTAQVSSKLGV